MKQLLHKSKPYLIWIFTFAVFYWLFKNNWIEASLFEKIETRFGWFLGGGILFFLCHLIANYRWIFLVRSQSKGLPYLKLVRFHWIGLFFNIALPGAVSGDIIKALLVSKASQGDANVSGSKTLSTIAVDRLLGVSGMLICSMTAFLFTFRRENQHVLFIEHFRTLGWLVGIPSVGLVLFFIWILFIGKRDDFFHQILSKINTNLSRLYEGFLDLGKRPKLLLGGLAVSTLIHILGIMGMICFIHVLEQEPSFDLFSVLFVVPLGFLATAIPILPGGVGTGHLAFRSLLQWVGISSGASIFSCFFFIQCLVGMVGGLVFAMNAKDVASAPSIPSTENLR